MAQGNFGQAPDLTTRVRLARCGHDLLVRFEAQEPTETLLKDILIMVVKGEPLKAPPVISGQIRPWFSPPGTLRQDPQRSFTVNGEGECAGFLQPTLISSTHEDGVWAVVVKCPIKALGIAAGTKTVEAQFERQRAARSKIPASDYYWVPPMRPPWQSHARFGRLEIETK
jgi:hypothetical protein